MRIKELLSFSNVQWADTAWKIAASVLGLGASTQGDRAPVLALDKRGRSVFSTGCAQRFLSAELDASGLRCRPSSI